MITLRSALVLGVAGASLAACATAPQVAAPPAPSPTHSAAAAAAAPQCGNATQSYAPSGTSSYALVIKSRGFLVAGISADTNLLGAVDPGDPSTFRGFDIEMVRAVATAIFGDAGPGRVRYKVISAADRIPELTADVNATDIAKGGVDLVARAFTMNCARWQQVAFSAEYFHATQKLLVATNSTVTGVAGAPKGFTVCAPTGTTSLAALKPYPNVVPVGVANHTDCLALFQEGSVKAITGDDAILAGFKSQDPYAKVLPTAFGDPQPYGLGINKAHVDFVRFVNGVLEGMRADGGWQRDYDATLGPALGVKGVQPTPVYGR